MDKKNAFGEEGHEANSPLEMSLDMMSKETYEKYDEMSRRALDECEKEESELSATELRRVRGIIGWEERLLVWLIRITFFLALHAVFNVKFKEYDNAVKRLEILESKVKTELRTAP